jgi:hypothetical protein
LGTQPWGSAPVRRTLTSFRVSERLSWGTNWRRRRERHAVQSTIHSVHRVHPVHFRISEATRSPARRIPSPPGERERVRAFSDFRRRRGDETLTAQRRFEIFTQCLLKMTANITNQETKTAAKRAIISARIHSRKSPLGRTQSGDTKRIGYSARIKSESEIPMLSIPPSQTPFIRTTKTTTARNVRGRSFKYSFIQAPTLFQTPLLRIRFVSILSISESVSRRGPRRAA